MRKTVEEKKVAESAYNRKYRETHLEELKAKKREYMREYAKTHADKRKDYQFAYHKAHKERLNEYQRNYHAVHKTRVQAQTAKWREEHPEEVQILHIRSRYGVTRAEAEQLIVARQSGTCMICGQNRSKKILSIDHDHDTKLIRGLLCNNCNQGLGYFADNPEWLEAAAEFIRQARCMSAHNIPK